MGTVLTTTTLPCILLISYIKLKHPTRLFFQSFILIPILFFSSLFVTCFGGLIKYNFILSSSFRIWILQELFKSFGLTQWFMFEFWTGLRYVVSGDDDGCSSNDNLGNCILLGNHGNTLFDFIPLGSIADYYNRVNKSFCMIKKEVLIYPIFGWVEAVSPHGVALSRSWDKDKIYLAKLCNKFNDNNGEYKYVNPWMWYIFPEGTRFSKKKLLKAQEFAKERGLTVLKHLLQPRVKGFSYLTQHLHSSLDTIVDATILYSPKPPQPMDLFYGTRFCKYIHIHLRVFKKNNIPKNKNDLDKWIRDKWAEKDKIMENMKNGQIKYKKFNRQEGKFRAIFYYSVYALFTKYFVINYLFGILTWSIISISMLILCFFPIVIVLIEHSQQ